MNIGMFIKTVKLEQYGEIIDWLADENNDTTVPAAMKSKARSLINQLHKFRIYSLQCLFSMLVWQKQ